MSLTERVASFIRETNVERIPREAIGRAKRAALDCFGVTLAGAVEPAGRIVAEYVRALGGNPKAGVVGSGFRTSPPLAALALGTMAHALDYDDYTYAMLGHPSAPVLPVALSLGQAHHMAGKRVLEAFLVGFEVEVKLGSLLGEEHYRRGWHSTATVGTLGAAAAAAKILGLSFEQTVTTLGIASSMAGGLRQNFGTMTKPLHVGNAAGNGVTAALLAKEGFTAASNILEAPLGFCQVFGAGVEDLSGGFLQPGNPFAIVSPGVALKPYPCCAYAHRSIEAVMQLITEHGLFAGDVEKVTCRLDYLACNALIHHRARTGLEGKFSLEYCVAAALLDHELRLRQFTDAMVQRPQAQELMAKVELAAQKEGKVPAVLQPHRVTVRLCSGRELSREVAIARGDPGNPLSDDELVAKYRDCAQLVLSPNKVERSLDMILNLEALDDISVLMDLATFSEVAR